jgi:FKBP-type peptidyl-prolyl cis-trans isomerase FklB
MRNPTIGMLRQACGQLVMIAVAGLGAAGVAVAQTPPPASNPPPATAPGADPGPSATSDQVSYDIGVDFGAKMRNSGIGNELVPETILRGMKDGLQGRQLTPMEMQQVQAFARSANEAAAARTRAAVKDFLSRNAHAPGVVTTASGLQYKILAAGDKKAPAITAADTVTVDYRGTLLDGTEFDSSYSRGAPTTFPIYGVIRGWQEALVMMKPGAKWQLFVPPELAYGPQPQGKIPADSLLIFEVNLLRIESANAPPKAPPGTPPSPKSK